MPFSSALISPAGWTWPHVCAQGSSSKALTCCQLQSNILWSLFIQDDLTSCCRETWTLLVQCFCCCTSSLQTWDVWTLCNVWTNLVDRLPWNLFSTLMVPRGWIRLNFFCITIVSIILVVNNWGSSTIIIWVCVVVLCYKSTVVIVELTMIIAPTSLSIS